MLAVRLLPLAVLLALAAASPAQAIVGGTETQRDWPHMAGMEFRSGDGFAFRCGGSLVRPDVVLSAAHCVSGNERDGEPDTLPAADFRFLLGSRDRESGGERIGVTQVVEHPEWDDGEDSHDVALLKLERPATLGTPIRIADGADAANFEPGDPSTIIGWGATSSGSGSVRFLREAEVPIRGDAECARNYTFTASFDAGTGICAGNLGGGEDTCQGDSGGPLMVPGADGRFVLVGDTSFGVGCAFATQYGVYGEVAGPVLRPWVDARLAELSPGTAAPAQGTGPTGAGSAGGSGTTDPSGDAAALAPVVARLRLPSVLGSARRARARRRIVVPLRTSSEVGRVRVVLVQRGRTVAVGVRSRRFTRAARVTLRLRRPVRRGRATLRVTARDGSGRVVRASRRVRLRG